MYHKKIWGAAIAILWGKCVAFNAYTNKEERLRICTQRKILKIVAN